MQSTVSAHAAPPCETPTRPQQFSRPQPSPLPLSVSRRRRAGAGASSSPAPRAAAFAPLASASPEPTRSHWYPHIHARIPVDPPTGVRTPRRQPPARSGRAAPWRPWRSSRRGTRRQRPR
uniref:Gbp2 n=1 Tax=Arundo donax TaxID=35708 RepID=A0A0A9DJL9_ARUDO